MKWLALILRILVGLPFFAGGLTYFFMKMEMPDLPEPATHLMAALGPTHWLTVIKVLEVAGGAILLSGRFVPLGLVLLVPVTVNIALWDILIMKFSAPPAGVILLVLEAVLIGLYWKYFQPLLTAKTTVG